MTHRPAAAAPIVTFGEILLRLSPAGVERLFQSPEMRTWWGGAEANVAAGLAWLGTPSAHVTLLPENALGDAAIRTLRADGVDMSHVQRRAGRLGLYFLESGAGQRPLQVTYDRAGSVFANQDGSEFDWPHILDGAAGLHLSGVSAALGDAPYAAMRAAVAAARAANIPVSLDLNYRPALWGSRDARPLMQPLAADASLLIGNPGAIERMLGIDTAGTWPETAEAVEETARAVHSAFGCTRVAITQREILSASEHGWQAHMLDSTTGNFWSARRYQVQLVDRVGGGDSFAAALLHGLRMQMTPEDALHFATAAGALKLTIAGDVNRVTSADVTTFLHSMR